MLAKRLSMRNTREILRLRWGLGRSLRDTGLSCGANHGPRCDRPGSGCGLGLALPDDLDDGALEARLYPPPGP